MQDNSRAIPRLTAVAATALVIAAIAAFAWLVAGGGVADAAGTASGSSPSGQTLPVQSDDQAAQDRDGDGDPCPEEGQGGGSGQDSGSSGQQAPESSSTPSTEL